MQFDYEKIIPITSRIPAERQSAKRHYGVHPYFTRRPFNVVRKYILNYSKEGDYILDPFGGSGVTAIEAAFENRIGIHNDINPFANYVARSIFNLSHDNLYTLGSSLISLEEKCKPVLTQIENNDEASNAAFMQSLKLPINIKLPSNSDVEFYHDLFTKKQLLSLTFLKSKIEETPDEFSRDALLLALSATLAKLNKTFLSAKNRAESRGGSSIFSIYRYKIAKNPIELNPWETFYERALNVIAAKEEINTIIEFKERTGGWTGYFQEHALDIDELSKIYNEKIDYIFTDPPYGGHISYLDLSTLWNNWHGFLPAEKIREKEIIVGGELKFTEEIYLKRLYESIRSCLKMLKPNRWFSVVFQHWNVKYFEAILNAAEEENAILKSAISQVGDPIWSMHKKKNKETVLAGELILSFFKTSDIILKKEKSDFDILSSIKSILNKNSSGKIYGEALFNHLIISAWYASSINHIDIKKEDFISIMNNLGWQYNQYKHYWENSSNLQNTLFGS